MFFFFHTTLEIKWVFPLFEVCFEVWPKFCSKVSKIAVRHGGQPWSNPRINIANECTSKIKRAELLFARPAAKKAMTHYFHQCYIICDAKRWLLKKSCSWGCSVLSNQKYKGVIQINSGIHLEMQCNFRRRLRGATWSPCVYYTIFIFHT